MTPQDRQEDGWRKRLRQGQINRLSIDRLERVEKVAEYWLKGKGLRVISQLVGLSVAQVKRDVDHARKMWAESFETNVQALINKELARLDRIEAEAWRAWERSQAKQIERVEEKTESVEHGTTIKKGKRTKQPIGDAAMLAIPLKCVEMRLRFLEFITRDNGGSSDDIVVEAVEVIVKNREEAQGMLTYEQFRNIAKTDEK